MIETNEIVIDGGDDVDQYNTKTTEEYWKTNIITALSKQTTTATAVTSKE
jgi:hypothetical protein